ncbi:MAG: flagellin [Gammaproteobacteria bacterium]|nr:flagellin [Gammaproteobacteria bacterium]
MPQIINTNIASLNAQRNLNRSQGDLGVALQRLSSGLRINSAKDDAAGLAISERMTAQIRGLNQAARNANDGISLAQTAEGALQSAGDILQRIRELSVQSANASNSASDRQALNNEVSNLVQELDRVAQQTEFNGRKLLDGSFTSAVFQVGANAHQTINVTSANFRTTAYGNYRIGASAATTTGGNGELTVGSTVGSTISSAWGTLGASRVGAGTLTVNGAAGSVDVGYGGSTSAKDVAALVNAQTENTGVTASARTEVNMTGFAADTTYTMLVASDNSTSQAQTISFTTGSSINADGLAAAINAFNDVSSKTGVTAKLADNGTDIVLQNSAGNDVRIVNDSVTGNDVDITDVNGGNTVTATAANGVGVFGTNDAWITGELTFDSEKSFNVVDTNAGAVGTGTGFLLTVAGDAAQLQKVSDMDVTTFDSATRTLAMVDSALAAVNGQRAKYGAVQSRFETTIGNLQTTSENLSAARSRIRDADFATETAELTRAQILQQAGVSVLAQANVLPQNALSLLQ